MRIRNNSSFTIIYHFRTQQWAPSWLPRRQDLHRELLRCSRSSLCRRTRPRRCSSTKKFFRLSLRSRRWTGRSIVWTLSRLDRVARLEQTFLSVTRFDKVTFDSGEENFLASRLAGSTSPLVCRASDRMVVDRDLGLLHVALCFVFRGLRNFFFRTQICLAELKLLVKEASSFVGQVSLWNLFHLSRQNENSQGNRQAVLDVSLTTSSLASSLMTYWFKKGSSDCRGILERAASAVARPNGQPRQTGVARGGSGACPTPRPKKFWTLVSRNAICSVFWAFR